MKPTLKGELWFVLFVAALNGSSDQQDDPHSIVRTAASIADTGVIEVIKRYPDSIIS